MSLIDEIERTGHIGDLSLRQTRAIFRALGLLESWTAPRSDAEVDDDARVLGAAIQSGRKRLTVADIAWSLGWSTERADDAHDRLQSILDSAGLALVESGRQGAQIEPAADAIGVDEVGRLSSLPTEPTLTTAELSFVCMLGLQEADGKPILQSDFDHRTRERIGRLCRQGVLQVDDSRIRLAPITRDSLDGMIERRSREARIV